LARVAKAIEDGVPAWIPPDELKEEEHSHYTVGGTLQFSNGFVSNTDGVFAGGSGSGGSGVIDLISAGLGLATAIAQRGQGTTMNQVPVGSTIGPAVVGGAAGAIATKAMDALLNRAPAVPTTSLSVYDRRYIKKDGTPRRIKQNGLPWKTPSMNVANISALRRSMRRVEGFASIAKRTMSFVQHHHLKAAKRKRK